MRGCNVLALFIRSPPVHDRLFRPVIASRDFLTESRLLRMSSIGMKRTSLVEWPAWLKCGDTGVVVVSCW